MPAAAVIPAPKVYIKVVAVKKLVVGFWDGAFGRTQVLYWTRYPHTTGASKVLLTEVSVRSGKFTLKKLECSKQALKLEYSCME